MPHACPIPPTRIPPYLYPTPGDFLLARAAVLLAGLGNCKAVELMSTAIEEITVGGLMQAKNSE